jgi:hypothetical protein
MDRAETRPGSHPRTIAIGAALFVAAVFLPLLRQPGTRMWDRIFSEDGSIYTQQAIRNGALHSLFRGYAGYLQLPPRLLAVAASMVPVRQLAIFLALAGTTVLALLGLFVYHATRTWLESVPLRLALAAVLVIGPAVGMENTANITNTIWTFAAVAPWALVSLEERPLDTLLRSVVALLAATATPLCAVYLPIAIAWAVFRRTRSAIVVASSFGVGLVIQGLVIPNADNTSQPTFPNHLGSLADELALRVSGFFLVGPRLITSWVHHRNAVVEIVLVAAVCSIFAVLFRATTRRRWQLLAAAFLAASVLTFAVPIWARGTEYLRPFLYLVSAYRYSIVPVFLLVSAVAILLAPAAGASPAVRKLALPIFIAQLLVVTALSFSTPASLQLDWKTTVAATYRNDCHATPSSRIVVVQTIPIVIQSAVGAHNAYAVALPCRELAP